MLQILIYTCQKAAGGYTSDLIVGGHVQKVKPKRATNAREYVWYAHHYHPRLDNLSVLRSPASALFLVLGHNQGWLTIKK